MPTVGFENWLRPHILLWDIQKRHLAQLPACSACNQPAFEAFNTPHNCRLCGFCWVKLLDIDEGQLCPGSQANARCSSAPSFRRQDCRPDAEARLQLSSVLVRCCNYLSGCPYFMPYMKLASHEEVSCLFKRVSCPGCGRCIRRGSLGSHQSSDECRQFLLANLGIYRNA